VGKIANPEGLPSETKKYGHLIFVPLAMQDLGGS